MGLNISAYSNGGLKLQFKAGSYSGYNEWREELAELGKCDSCAKPFYELICFSDCQGIINSEISKKLYQDFLDFNEKATKVEDDWFKSIYLQFKEAFRLASNNGFVKFH